MPGQKKDVPNGDSDNDAPTDPKKDATPDPKAEPKPPKKKQKTDDPASGSSGADPPKTLDLQKLLADARKNIEDSQSAGHDD